MPYEKIEASPNCTPEMDNQAEILSEGTKNLAIQADVATIITVAITSPYEVILGAFADEGPTSHALLPLINQIHDLVKDFLHANPIIDMALASGLSRRHADDKWPEEVGGE